MSERKKFNKDWDQLPEDFKERFLEILGERGLAEEFDSLSEDLKAQILEILKEHVFPGENDTQ
jgi:hypothetical protein